MFETIICPICNSDTYQVLIKANYPAGSTGQIKYNYSASSDTTLMDQVVKCSSCSLIYLNPRPKREIILASYTGAEDLEFVRYNPERVLTFKRYVKYLVKKFSWARDKSIKVIDIGCAGGAFPKAASDFGLDIVGVEPSEWLAQYGRDEYALTIKTGVIEDQDIPVESFHCVTMWDVIEHMTCPRSALTKIYDILKPDGVLVINFPNHDSIMRRLLGKNWPFYLSVHLTYFTPKTIATLLNQNGFSVEQVKPFFQTLPLGYLLKRASTYFPVFGFINKLIKLLGMQKLSIKYNMGQSILIAKKTLPAKTETNNGE